MYIGRALHGSGSEVTRGNMPADVVKVKGLNAKLKVVFILCERTQHIYYFAGMNFIQKASKTVNLSPV